MKRALCGALLLGCSGSADALPSEPKRVLLGTGEAEFEPLTGEPRARLAAGSQGGFHVWASFLAYGFREREVDMVLVTNQEDVEDARLVMRAELTLRQGVDEHGEPVLSFAGFPAQIDRARCAHDQRVQLEVTLSDRAGDGATDARSVIADVDPIYRSSDCD